MNASRDIAEPARTSIGVRAAQSRLRLGWLNSSKGLGILFLLPAVVLVVLFFIMPVVLTGVFAFTNMSTATGITGGAHQVSPGALRLLTDRYDMGELAERHGFDEAEVVAFLSAPAEHGHELVII